MVLCSLNRIFAAKFRKRNMKYYSTNGNAPIANLQKAVVKGLAEDRGLYMPERIPMLSSVRMSKRKPSRKSFMTHCRSTVRW